MEQSARIDASHEGRLTGDDSLRRSMQVIADRENPRAGVLHRIHDGLAPPATDAGRRVSRIPAFTASRPT